MSYILPREINVKMLAALDKDKQAIIKALWPNGSFSPVSNESFIKKFMSIKDPIRLARRARAYVSLVGDPHVTESTFTSEFTLIVNQLWKAGFDGQQIRDIAQTKANIPVLMYPQFS